jgi:putative ATPase
MSNSNSPLADRMRPLTLDEVIGQDHLLSEGKFINRMIVSGVPVPSILYGPPGTGKTTIAMAMAGTFGIPFFYINATKDGKKDVEKALKDATPENPVMVFVDEAHRFSVVQQEPLLPYTESGACITIMASTENPFHQIVPGLRSRMRILELKKLSQEQIKLGVVRALSNVDRGLGDKNAILDTDALEYVGRMSNGDMRIALSAVEMAVLSTLPNETGQIIIDVNAIGECLQSTSHHDNKGDQYYNLLAALQKSIQGSSPNAALHYTSRLIDAGEIDMLMRRLVVTAHEDIGLAAPHLGTTAITTWQGLEMIGMPEGRILIGKLVIEMCMAPKSNSAYVAIDKALTDVRNGWIGEIPKHMRDASYTSAEYLGNGVGYKYPHDYFRQEFGGWVNQVYMPEGLGTRDYYNPIEAGEEVVMAKRTKQFKIMTEQGM